MNSRIGQRRPRQSRGAPPRRPRSARSRRCSSLASRAAFSCTRSRARRRSARRRRASGRGGIRGCGRASPPRWCRSLRSDQLRTASHHVLGISESSASRARTSSLRLVSCVEVASIGVRPVLLRGSQFAAWNSSTARARTGRVAADLVERDEAVVVVERRVLDPLGHHRAGELLEPHAPAPTSSSPVTRSGSRSRRKSKRSRVDLGPVALGRLDRLVDVPRILCG